MDNIVYIGMDLGCFKTSVVSSTGDREVIYSAVGWPKDHVAERVLGSKPLFGREVVEKRLALKACWPFRKGALKFLAADKCGIAADELDRQHEAASLLVQHAVEQIRPPQGAKVYGVIGAPSRASIGNKEFLLQIASGTFDAVAITPEPFAVAFGMNELTNSLVIDIGAGTIDICPLYSSYPADEDQVTIPVGGDAVDEAFMQRITDLHPKADLTANVAREIKEKFGFVHDIDDRAVVQLDLDARPTEFDVTDALKAACMSLVDPIIEGIHEVIGRCDSEFRRPMLQNVILAGGGSQLAGLDRLVEQALEPYGGGHVRKVGDSVYAGAAGALKLAMHMPTEEWEMFRTSQEAAPVEQPQQSAA